MDELKITEDNAHKYISEAFGMDNDLFRKIVKHLTVYMLLKTIGHALGGDKHDDSEEHKEKTSRTKVLEGYLKSEEFKSLGWEPKTANDFFMLGFIFNAALEKEETLTDDLTGKMAGSASSAMMAKLLGGDDVSMLLKLLLRK